MDSTRLTISRAYAQYTIVTDHAIIRVERRSEEEQRQASAIVLAVGGIVGPVLAAITDRIGMPGGPTRLYLRPRDMPPLAEISDVMTCWAAEAPAELTALVEWPRVEPYRPVTFYPRAAIAKVGLSRWRGIELTLKREAAREVVLPIPPWYQARVRLHLARAGYLSQGGGGSAAPSTTAEHS